MRARFLLFNTDYTAYFKNVVIKDGMAVIEDKEYPVDKTTPITIKSFIGSKPLYLAKWNSIYPAEFDASEKITESYKDERGNKIELVKKELVPLNPDDLKWQDKHKLTPKLIRDTGNLRFLRTMKRYAEQKTGLFGGGGEGGGGMPIIPVILAIVFGAIIMYLLIGLKIIPVQF